MAKKQAISEGKTYTVRLPQDLQKLVEEWQERHGTTPSEQIRRAVKFWFENLDEVWRKHERAEKRAARKKA